MKTLDVDIHQHDCERWLQQAPADSFHLTFLDPPFNQGKAYRLHDDKLDDDEYWQWMTDILKHLCAATEEGGAVYFMQREKNAERVLCSLREAGWKLRNLLIWRKMTSAVPCSHKFGLCYQIIAFAVKGRKPRIFNRLRVRARQKPHQKVAPQKKGVYVTDVWDDIREMTSGYFAGPEAIRNGDGERFHKQQSPLGLLARIILSSSMPGDVVYDPFSGTGTTLIAAALLGRKAVGVELDPVNVERIRERASLPREADVGAIAKLRELYSFTDNFAKVWGEGEPITRLGKNESTNISDLSTGEQNPL